VCSFSLSLSLSVSLSPASPSVVHVTYCIRAHAVIAVGRDIFPPDANTFIEPLMRIQSASLPPLSPPVVLVPTYLTFPCLDSIDSSVDPGDTLLNHYLIATLAKICQAMGPEFEPYLPVIMPPIVNAASTKADIPVYGK
jgi:importin-5